MPRKFVRVRGGMIFFDFPEDLVAWDNALRRIFEKARDVASREQVENPDDLNRELWETNQKEFESVFGEGSCQTTFLTDLPSAQAILEFRDKFNCLLDEWSKKEVTEIKKHLGYKAANKFKCNWKRMKRESLIFKKI